MFGRKPKLPIDIPFDKAREDDTGNRDTNEYIRDLKDKMKKTQEIIEKHVKKSKDKQKSQYDRKAKAVEISVGDRVLVRKLAFVGKHKIEDKFEKEVYQVIEKPRFDLPVFKVLSEDTKRERTLHRNHLLLLEKSEDRVNANVERQGDIADRDDVIKHGEVDVTGHNQDTQGDVTDEDDSESDSDIGFVVGTSQNGDAHVPITGQNTTKETAVEKQLDSQLIEVVNENLGVGLEDDASLNVDDSDLHTYHDIDISDTHHEDEEADGEDMNETDHQSNNEEEGTDISVLLGETIEDKDLTVVKQPAAEADITSAETEEEERPSADASGENRPVLQPRRTGRTRKPPDRYGDYFYPSHQMTVRPIDNRLQALDSLMRSGILNGVDSDIAHRMIEAIMGKSNH